MPWKVISRIRGNLIVTSVAMMVVSAMMTSAPRTSAANAPADPPAATRPTGSGADYAHEAAEVIRYIQATYYDPHTRLYSQAAHRKGIADMWANGVMFAALVGAARHDARTYRPLMDRFFAALDRYWDAAATIPGYEPTPTLNGHDKYYDDNAWMVITFAEAYELTHDERYLTRARQTLRFVLSGWDDKLGGGIRWQEQHLDGTKNTCSNAPAAVAALALARLLPPPESTADAEMAHRIIQWTIVNLEDPKDGLFEDRKVVATGEVKRGKLTYNSALMIRALLDSYRRTGNRNELEQAERIGRAADAFVDARTHAYRDPVKWSHLQVEADLQLFGITNESHLMQRAKDTCDYSYAMWKARPPDDLIDNAAIARMLWLMADAESPEHPAAGAKQPGGKKD